MKAAFVARTVTWRMQSLPAQVGNALQSGVLSSGQTASPAAAAEGQWG